MTIPVSRYALAASLALAICFASSPGAFAAEPELLFEDDFSELDPSFGSSTENLDIAVKDHMLLIAGKKPTWGMKAFYQSGVYTDADITIRCRLAEPEAEKGAEMGIGFWALDYTQYYAFAISDSSTVSVYSTNGKRWLYPVSWRRNSALKTDAEEWNELRVVTVGNWATLYLNGKRFASIKGKPPEGGGLMGPFFYAGSEPASAQFSQLKVVAPSGPDAIAPEEASTDPNLIFSDDFATFDPAWGVESGSASVKDNKFIVKPEPQYTYRFFNGAVLATDLDMSAKVQVSDNDPKSWCAAGLVFWAQADNDYFYLQLADDGTVGVSRFLKTRWLSPIPFKAAPAEAKLQPGGAAELRVVTSGRKAVCYINGVSIGSVTTQPMKEECQFGMAASCGQAQAVAEFSTLRVLKPGSTSK
ncbi:MAG TPA: hypothetical protein VHC19_13680 [Pirellulales bacterium]|nr:hypothetical protein [Pirellulales bacterium]